MRLWTERRCARGVCCAVGVVVVGLIGAAPSVAAAGDFAWAGIGASAHWSAAGNWSGSAAPSGSLGQLSFPALTDPACAQLSPIKTCYTSTNDIRGLAATSITVDDGVAYQITGDAITLGAGGLTATSSAHPTCCASFYAPITLDAAQRWSLTGEPDSALTIGPVSGPEPLALALSGGTNLDLDGAVEVGPVTLSGHGALNIGGGEALNAQDRDAVKVSGGAELTADFPGTSAGPVSVAAGQLVVGDGLIYDGTLAVKGAVTLTAASSMDLFVDEAGTRPSRDFSQLAATGPVTLGDARLHLAMGEGGSTGPGCQTLTIGNVDTLIKTTGVLRGVFARVPNGALVRLASTCSRTQPTVKITYTHHAVTATIVKNGTGRPAFDRRSSRPLTRTSSRR